MPESSTPTESTGAEQAPPSKPKSSYQTEVEAAAYEMFQNPDQYWDVVQAVRAKRPVSVITKEIGEAIREAGRDMEVLAPVIENTTRALRDGSSTSEFKMMSAVNKILSIVAILAPVIEGSIAAYQATHGEPTSFGSSMILTGVSVFLKTFIADRYAKGRVSIKQAAAQLPFEVEVIRDAE